jgi:hypothetical protein
LVGGRDLVADVSPIDDANQRGDAERDAREDAQPHPDWFDVTRNASMTAAAMPQTSVILPSPSVPLTVKAPTNGRVAG